VRPLPHPLRNRSVEPVQAASALQIVGVSGPCQDLTAPRVAWRENVARAG